MADTERPWIAEPDLQRLVLILQEGNSYVTPRHHIRMPYGPHYERARDALLAYLSTVAGAPVEVKSSVELERMAVRVQMVELSARLAELEAAYPLASSPEPALTSHVDPSPVPV